MGAPVLTLREVADLVGGRIVGDADVEIASVAPLDEARPDQLGFLAAKRYSRFAAESEAGAFLVSADLESAVEDGRTLVVVEDAHRALAALLRHLHPAEPEEAGIHPTAVVGKGVRLGEGVYLAPYAVIEDNAVIGDRCRIGAHAVVGTGAQLGRNCTLHPHVVLYPRTVLGDRVIVHAGTRLGVDGFGYTFEDGAHRKVPHVGRCVIEDDVEIGANTTVDRGSIGDTVVGRGAKLDNLIQLGHNVRVGELSLMASMVGVAGSTRIGKGVLMGGQAGVIGHLEIEDGAQVAAAARVMRDVSAGETVAGDPARPNREYLRTRAHVERLPRLLERVKALEKAVDALRGHR